ncbi:MAG TPA: thioredoxin domain-containing protein [Dermatophilaceae bacterium]|nr:thioredoxin domain-containing protein [Dermatophilaceae bacterium]
MRPDASKKIATVTPKGGPNVVIIGAVIAVVVVLLVVVAIVIGKNSESGSSGSASGNAVPVGVVGGTGGGILANPAAAKSTVPTVDVYSDFQCPVCAKFEEQFGPALTAMAKAGEIKYVVHMMSFLDDNLGNDSSKRSTNAAACAADAGKFLEYHSAVFAAQPAKEGDGYTDAQLAEFAKTAGITGAALTTWQQCTTSGQHAQYVTDVADTSGKAGVTGTPTVKINGKDITKTLTTPEALVAAVKAATS